MPRVLDPDEHFARILADARPGVHRGPAVGPVYQWRRWWLDIPRDTELVRAAARQGFVLTTTDAARLGLTRATTRHAIVTGRWSAPVRGAVAVVDVREPNDRHVEQRRLHALAGSAAVLVRPWFVASGRTAAIMHGLPTLTVPKRPEVTTPLARGPGHRSGAHVHAAGLDRQAMMSWFGAPVQTPARVLVDLARHDRRDAIMAADAALREHVVSPADVEAELGMAVQWPGVKQARAVLALASPLAESPLESLLRLACHEDDEFPDPKPQYYIGDDRVDIAFPEQRLVVEADGRAKYGDDEPWRQRQREARLRAAGWWVERVLWQEVLDWPVTRVRLLAALHLHRPSGY